MSVDRCPYQSDCEVDIDGYILYFYKIALPAKKVDNLNLTSKPQVSRPLVFLLHHVKRNWEAIAGSQLRMVRMRNLPHKVIKRKVSICFFERFLPLLKNIYQFLITV